MLNEKVKILLIEDEDFDVRRVKNTIELMHQNLEIIDIVSNGLDALNLIKEKPSAFDVIIMDYQIAGGLRGEELILEIKKIDYSIQIVVITKLTIDMTDFDFANRLLNAGAFWYCTKYPGDIEKFIYQPTDFLISLFNGYEKRKLELKNLISKSKLKENIDEILMQKKIIGNNEVTKQLLDQIEKYAKTDVNILIYGESGTGKELVANNIHYRSNRKYEKFVPINCGGLPHDLIESELFGYEKGAFTGAVNKKLGLFEIANNGTIFLDEVSELPPSAQVKLLRVIQEGEIEKIGRTDRIKVNVRIIAATNKNLEELVRENKFREDLYYRLNVVPIKIQPLRKRQSDISELIEHFLLRFSREMSLQKPSLDSSGMEYLLNYSWFGNVRELKNVVQRLLFLDSNRIDEKLIRGVLSAELYKESKEDNIFNFDLIKDILTLKDLEVEFRHQYFSYVREKSASDADAAKKLGLAPPNYYRMSKELGLK